MGQSELAAHQRMQLEAVLEEFENALRNCVDGNLPDVELFLSGIHGEVRTYLEREMRTLLRELVRGNYLVLNPIEAGGMGSISKVRHLRLGKTMALKEIRAEALQIGDRDELLRRFQREIEACGRLDEHPNIVSYTDTGVNEAGVPFLVMDYIDGEDLGKIVRRAGPLRIADAAQVIHDAAIGLAHAHDNGLVHRDVKPSNIMVSRHGTVKVLDFGLARITTGDHQLTALTTGKVMGTFDYMSPELCREITPDSRGDIYSLGCTFYYVLAGKAPFEESKSQFEKMDAHLHADPAPIPRLDEQSALRAILEKMMAKDPEDRYQDLHQAADALRPYCTGSDLRALVRSGKPRASGDGSSSSALARDLRYLTESRTTGSKAGDRTAEWTSLKEKRKRRLLLTVAVLFAGIALFASLLIADHWRRAHHRQEMAKVLGTLPGLNGRWWFDEAPWLLPNVRQELVSSLVDADEKTRQELVEALYRNPEAPEVYEHLEKLKLRFRHQWPNDVRSHLSNVQSFDLEDADPDSFAISLRDTARALDSKGRDTLTGAEMHLRAVIHHYHQELEPALQMYAAAADRYDQEGQAALRALCLLDWGEVLHGFRQPALAHSRFQLAYLDLAGKLPSGEPLPPLFELYAKAMEADSHRRIDNFPQAQSLLGRAWGIAKTLHPNHPLRAFVLERRGWLYLDLWRLEEARADFQTALKIRRSHEPENHRARHFIYWDQQGVGMAHMYMGRPADARAEFQKLLDQINLRQGAITARQRSELEDRRPNLYERLADTALFTGNVEWEGMDVDPVEELKLAIQYANELNFADDGRKSVLIRLKYKAAVVHAMRGDVDGAEELMAKAAALEPPPREGASNGGGSSSGSRPPAYELTKKFAIVVRQWRSPAEAEQARGRADALKLIARTNADLSRDDLLLLLYVAENLLGTAELTQDERLALAEQIERLIHAQPFPPLGSGKTSAEPGIPGVFERYLEMAKIVEDGAGKE